MIRASVLGATGYTGAELLRLLSGHPEVKVVSAASRSFAGKELKEIYGNFVHAEKLKLVNPEELAEQSQDLVFLCLPHGESLEWVPKLADAGMRVIDLSADFRYRDPALYEEWYERPHTALDHAAKAVYGLPEYHAKEIQNAALVANPGCYATAAILALTPLVKADLIEPSGIVVNGASGTTGAGRAKGVNYSFCEVDENYRAYAPVRHRHTSEMEEQIGILSEKPISLLFTPHLLPVKRGILETIYVRMKSAATKKTIAQAYADAYGDAVFTSALPAGHLPEIKMVTGSNNCLIGFEISERTSQIVLCAALDNLIKGAAGQAVQNMNLMYGLAQDTGLPWIASYL